MRSRLGRANILTAVTVSRVLAVLSTLWLALCLTACGSGDTYATDVKAAVIPPVARPVSMGVYVGAGHAQRIPPFEQQLGRRVDYVADYLDKSSWEAMKSVHWLGEAWANRFRSTAVITVPMLPDEGDVTMADGAAGRYDEHFRQIARNLVGAGLGEAVLRIGPEFNGRWFKWSIGRTDGGKLYAAYFRHIVTAMRSTEGANFKIDWCPNGGSAFREDGKGQLDAASGYPGDIFVDYIGLDVFDQSWTPGSKNDEARWREFVTMKNGLAWHARFAAAHHKPMTFPEWGLAARPDGHGGGDNPYFVKKMFQWMQTHRTAYHLYFESGDPNGEYGVFSGDFPKAAASFVNYFGSGAQASATALAQG